MSTPTARFVRIGGTVVNPATVTRVEPHNTTDSRIHFDHSSFVVRDLSPDEVAWLLMADDQLERERLRHPANRRLDDFPAVPERDWS